MDNRFNVGDVAYIVCNTRFIREVKIKRIFGRKYTVCFTDSDGGINLNDSRLYENKEAAEASIQDKKAFEKRYY